MLNAAPDPILGVDTNGLIVFANTQAEQAFGYPAKELLEHCDEKSDGRPGARRDVEHARRASDAGRGGGRDDGLRARRALLAARAPSASRDSHAGADAREASGRTIMPPSRRFAHIL